MKTIDDKKLSKDIIIKQLLSQIKLKCTYKSNKNIKYEKYVICSNLNFLILSGETEHKYNIKNMRLENLIHILNHFNINLIDDIIKKIVKNKCIIDNNDVVVVLNRKHFIVYNLCNNCYIQYHNTKKIFQIECKICGKKYFNIQHKSNICSKECLTKNRSISIQKNMIKFNKKHHWTTIKSPVEVLQIYDKIGKNSSKTKKKKYNSGELIIWNKGKKLDDTYCENNRKAQLNFWNSLSDTEKEKRKTLHRNIALRNLQQYKNKTSIEKKIDIILNYLKLNNIINFYKYSFILKYRQFDFYVLGKNNKKYLIECQGDYWHGNLNNPKIYKRGLTDKQISRKLNDKMKEKIAIDNGYKYIELWEYDINKNINGIENILREALC